MINVKNAKKKCIAKNFHFNTTNFLFVDEMKYFAIFNSIKKSKLYFDFIDFARSNYFVLFQNDKNKKHYFNIFVNDQFSWMMHILLKVTINDEKLRKNFQITFHSKNENIIMIESYNFVIFIFKNSIFNEWLSIEFDFLNCFQIKNTQLTSFSTNKNSNTLRHKLSQLQNIVFHKIKQITNHSFNHEIIYRNTKKHVIEKFYDAKNEQIAKLQYNFLFDVLKIFVKLLIFNQCWLLNKSKNIFCHSSKIHTWIFFSSLLSNTFNVELLNLFFSNRRQSSIFQNLCSCMHNSKEKLYFDWKNIKSYIVTSDLTLYWYSRKIWCRFDSLNFSNVSQKNLLKICQTMNKILECWMIKITKFSKCKKDKNIHFQSTCIFFSK